MSNCSENDNTVGQEMRDKAYNLCRKFLSGEWKKISSSDMVFKTVSGGLSNFLYYCSLPATHTPLNGEPSQVLLRMYGQLLDGNDAKVTDSVITMLLSERKLGPKLYGIFPGGRLEEYIPTVSVTDAIKQLQKIVSFKFRENRDDVSQKYVCVQSLGLPTPVARAMLCEELKDPIYSATIARKLATVHSLDVPINKEPTWLFDTLNQWLETVRNPQTSDKTAAQTSKNPELEQELCSFDFESELKWLKQFLGSCNSPVVFSHNDLQEGNILLPESASIKMCPFDDRIVFIDFEFCAYNYRGFDLGNHFCERMFDYSNPEWPHFFVYTDAYPDDCAKRHFLREYLKQSKEHKNAINDTEDQLIKEANYYTLASHFLWTLWSINNARNSKIQFGYLEYGKTRLTAYVNHKDQLLRKFSDQNLNNV